MSKAFFVILGNIFLMPLTSFIDKFLFLNHSGEFERSIHPLDNSIPFAIVYLITLWAIYQIFYRRKALPVLQKLAKSHVLFVISSLFFQILGFMAFTTTSDYRWKYYVSTFVIIAWPILFVASLVVQYQYLKKNPAKRVNNN